MFYAINEETGREVYAPNIERDTSYPNPSEEKWIATEDSKTDIGLYKTVYVIYRSGSFNEVTGKLKRRPHFYCRSEDREYIKEGGESREHKLVKDFIYEKRKLKDFFVITTDKHKINIFSDEFKYHPETFFEWKEESELINRRADVKLQFTHNHYLYGRGIVIEIQLSKQTEENKKRRTEDWALMGYSVIWVETADIIAMNGNIDNIREDIFIRSNLELCRELKDSNISEWQEKYKEMSRDFDSKLEKLKDKDIYIYKLQESLENKYKEYLPFFENQIKDDLTMLFFKRDKLLDEFEKIKNQVYRLNIEEYRDDFLSNANNLISNFIEKSEKLNSVVEKLKQIPTLDFVNSKIESIENLFNRNYDLIFNGYLEKVEHITDGLTTDKLKLELNNVFCEFRKTASIEKECWINFQKQLTQEFRDNLHNIKENKEKGVLIE